MKQTRYSLEEYHNRKYKCLACSIWFNKRKNREECPMCGSKKIRKNKK
jgi:rubrerythrin